MKKSVIKICLLCIIAALLMSGCGSGLNKIFGFFESNKKPDDDISRAISEAVGEKMSYQSRKVDNKKKYVSYDYLIRDHDDPEVLVKLVNTVNEKLKNQKEKGELWYVDICISAEIPGGGETVVVLYNYYETKAEEKKETTLCRIYIWGLRGAVEADTSCYNKVSTYASLEGMKYLTIRNPFEEQAEEEGINWYVIWSDLEYYEVD